MVRAFPAQRLLSNSKALDGGPALYFIDPAADDSPNADRWVVFLEGGGICQHHSDCWTRKAGSLGTADKWDDEWSPGRSTHIISNDPARNPDLADWNHVFLPYVSGDIWLGTQTEPWNPWSETNTVDEACSGLKDDKWGTLAAAGMNCAAVMSAGATCEQLLGEGVPALFGPGAPMAQYSGGHMSDLCAASCTPCDSAATDVYVMEGHNIISDTINELINNHAIDTASDLILSGCSAGGLGTFENTDFVQSLLPNVRVVGNPQAGYFGTEFITFPKFVELGRDACSAGQDCLATAQSLEEGEAGHDLHWTSQLDKYEPLAVAACKAATGEGISNLGMELCSSVPLYYPHITSPMFVSEMTTDGYQLSAEGLLSGRAKMTEDGLEYVKYLSFLLGSSLNDNVINGPNRERDGLWAPACTDHCMSWKQGSKTVGGSEHWEIFSNWYGLFPLCCFSCPAPLTMRPQVLRWHSWWAARARRAQAGHRRLVSLGQWHQHGSVHRHGRPQQRYPINEPRRLRRSRGRGWRWDRARHRAGAGAAGRHWLRLCQEARAVPAQERQGRREHVHGNCAAVRRKIGARFIFATAAVTAAAAFLARPQSPTRSPPATCGIPPRPPPSRRLPSTAARAGCAPRGPSACRSSASCRS